MYVFVYNVCVPKMTIFFVVFPFEYHKATWKFFKFQFVDFVYLLFSL